MKIPRRNRMDKWHGAEIAIFNTMQMIEKMPAHPSLTQAQAKLSEAKDLVADWYDEELDKVMWCIEKQINNQTHWFEQSSLNIITGKPDVLGNPNVEVLGRFTPSFDLALKFKTQEEAERFRDALNIEGVITDHSYM